MLGLYCYCGYYVCPEKVDLRTNTITSCYFDVVDAVPSWVCCGLNFHLGILPLQVSEFSFPLAGHSESLLFSERGEALLSLSDFRCRATSLTFTFPSIGHVTSVWPEPAEHDRRDPQNASFLCFLCLFLLLLPVMLT